MSQSILINKEQAEILEFLLLNSPELSQADFDAMEAVQNQITNMIEYNEWED